MVWCSHCGDNCGAVRDPDKGYVCCTVCGKIVDQVVYSRDPVFEKTGSGESRLAGSILHSVDHGYSVSRQKTLEKGRYEISNISLHLNVGGGDSIVNKAHNFYKIAVERNFTKGRRTAQVAAACLYIACRHSEKAFLLIDFSDYLKISVYVLGAVFLQLCKMLRLADHPIVQKLIDPSLFIHRFTERLLGRRDKAVSDTALRIVASMKRDWMQTGRKPSGLCGAALYISALSHGLDYSKSDVVTVVHICEATLTKRLIEFENTNSGCLTIEEFIARADELDETFETYQSPTPGQVLCQHKDTDEPHFAHGLCKKCYDEFIKISGGLKGGAEPPAFQRAEMQRMQESGTVEKIFEANAGKMKSDSSFKPTSDSTGCELPASRQPNVAGNQVPSHSACVESEQDLHDEGTRDPENFSDIDDSEVEEYLHNEEEKKLKKIIWEEMNKEYLEEQAAKAAAAAAAKEASEASWTHDSEELHSAQELAAATAAALAKSRKEKRQKRAAEMKNLAPAKSPLEATCQVLKRKSFSSKINYKALESLYTDNSKKQRINPDVDKIEPNDVESMEEKDKVSDEEATKDDAPGLETSAFVADPVDGECDSYYNNGEYDNGHGDDDYGYDEWE